jgi:hypothetical protein
VGESGAKAAGASTLRRYAEESRSLGNSALLTAPVVLAYEVGLLLLGDRAVRNAADALIDQGLTALGRPAALAINLLVLAAVVVYALRKAPRKVTPLGLLLPVLLESALYACLLAPALSIIGRRMMAAPASQGFLEGLVLSLGAGFYEELVFRLAAVGGVLTLLERVFRVTSGWVTLAVLVGSALLFSWFHHAGPGGEPFTTRVFVMRSVAGILLGGVFIVRGFGVACYTHLIYDVLCLHAG